MGDIARSLPTGLAVSFTLSVQGERVYDLRAGQQYLVWDTDDPAHPQPSVSGGALLIVADRRTGTLLTRRPFRAGAIVNYESSYGAWVLWRELYAAPDAACPGSPQDCYTWALFEMDEHTGATWQLDRSHGPAPEEFSPVPSTSGGWLAWQAGTSGTRVQIRTARWGDRRSRPSCSFAGPAELAMDATAVFIQPPPAAATAGDIQICPLGGGHQSSVRLPFNASFLTVSPVGELAYARRQPDGSAVVVVGTSRNSGIAVEGDLYDLFWVDNGLLVADESSGLWLLNTHVHARQRVSFPIDPGVAVHAQDGTISFGVQRAGGTTLVVAKPTD